MIEIRYLNMYGVEVTANAKAMLSASVSPGGEPSPWHPETDPHRLKVLGKAMEEASELSTAIARCIIQGIDEVEPVTGKLNRTWLTEEIADVEANIAIVKKVFHLDEQAIDLRVGRKFGFLTKWLGQL